MTAQQEDVIDLTNSFTLVNHHNMKDVVIVLESDIVFATQPEQSPRAHRHRRRLAKSREAPRPAPSTSTTVYDLCTPDNKVKKKSVKSTIAQERKSTTPKNKNQNNDTDLKHCCAICFDTFGTNPLASTKCGHVFCLKCITLALKTEPKCPTCRRKLKGPTATHPIFI